MRRFAALPWGRNWAPAAPLAEVGRRSGGLRGGLADAGRADRQAWAGASPAVTDGLWSVRGRVLDWLLEPLPGTPPLLLRARVSVSCTDLGAPQAARLSRCLE